MCTPKLHKKSAGCRGEEIRRNGGWEEVGKYDLGRYISLTGKKVVWVGKGKKVGARVGIFLKKSGGEKRSRNGRVGVEK